MKKWIFSPFRFVAGEKALIIGWAVMIATACIAFFNNAHFDGAIDVHVGRISSFPLYFLEQFIVWGSVVLIFYFIGRLFSNTSVRFIDVAGTMALARWPMIFVALISFAEPSDLLINPISTAAILVALSSLPFIVWMIALMYSAFIISCNMKGGRATGLFILALVLSEVLSKILFYLIFTHTT